MRAARILWLRQIKRRSRSRSRIVCSLGQPLLFLLALGFGFGPVFARAGNGNCLDFVAPGIMTMAIIFTAVFGGIEMIWDRRFGVLKATLVAPVPRLAIVLGRTPGGSTVALLPGLIVFIIRLVAGVRPHHPLPLPIALGFMSLIAPVFTAIGTAIGSVLRDRQGFQLILHCLVLPLFFFFPTLCSPPRACRPCCSWRWR